MCIRDRQEGATAQSGDVVDLSTQEDSAGQAGGPHHTSPPARAAAGAAMAAAAAISSLPGARGAMADSAGQDQEGLVHPDGITTSQLMLGFVLVIFGVVLGCVLRSFTATIASRFRRRVALRSSSEEESGFSESEEVGDWSDTEDCRDYQNENRGGQSVRKNNYNLNKKNTRLIGSFGTNTEATVSGSKSGKVGKNALCFEAFNECNVEAVYILSLIHI